MVKLKCHHCSYVWDYKGKSPYYGACPMCAYKVHIKKYKYIENKDDRNKSN